METTAHTIKNAFGDTVRVPDGVVIDPNRKFVGVKYVQDSDDINQSWKPVVIYVNEERFVDS